MRSFEDLVAEAEATDVSGWDFSWLEGRATEERPPWGYARLMAQRLPLVESAIDLDTGGGEIIANLPTLPPRMVATEGWPPNAMRARMLLEPRGVEVVQVDEDAPLPFPDQTFDLVTSRHPVWTNWQEIHRVLRPGGRYLAQHVGADSAFGLIEFFLGPLPENRRVRDPQLAAAAAGRVGLRVVDLRSATCKLEYFDIGAIVYTLRKCVWWVPNFSVDRYQTQLRYLDRLIRTQGSFVDHSSRYLIEAER